VIQRFVPRSRQPAGVRSARVVIAATSLPASGSDSAKAPSASPEAIAGR
jgi:hypothetical protein